MAEDDIPWSNLGFAEEAAVFKGATQNARVLNEGWIGANAFCPALSFVIPGGGALAPQTRNEAARESAKLSRTLPLNHRLRSATARLVPGLRCAPPGMTKAGALTR